MGGGAFWDSVIIWLTVLPILAFGTVVAATKIGFRMMGKRVGWGRSALYVLGAFLVLQVVGSVGAVIYYR